jgi:hypothetical protein
MSSPSVGCRIAAMRVTMSLRSRLADSSGCLRANAIRRRTSSAPRSAASSIVLTISARLGSPATSSVKRSVMAMMAVSMLLKSWAMPPVSCPIASIFCAWRSWLSSCTRSVMSRPMKKCCWSGSDHTPVQASGTVWPSLCT